MSKRLARSDWIDAGLAVLATHGVDAVRVERIATDLGVTKGSFYWHFKDRSALLTAALEAWQSQATNAIITHVDAMGGDARTRLTTLFTVVASADGSLDRAIRHWAANDVVPRSAMDAVDRRRMSYLQALFAEIGFAPAEAEARARLVYHALVGQFAMGETTHSEARLREVLDIILPMMVRFDHAPTQ